MSMRQAPVVLRLAFHDAATYNAAAGDGGANASVRLELDRPENFGLKRGWRVIEAAMAGDNYSSLHMFPPSRLSELNRSTLLACSPSCSAL